jgi:hypothetical protein
MKRLTFVVATAIATASLALGQAYNAATMSPYRATPPPVGSTPGNILKPGGVSTTLHPTLLGGTISGANPYTGVQAGSVGRPRTLVVPYAMPVWAGGYYGYAGYGMPQAQPNITVVMPQQPAPTVVINQYGGADSGRTVTTAETVERGDLRVYEATPRRAEKPAEAGPLRSYVRDDKPNIYMIALKDDTVRQAIGYWVEGGLLKYVTPQATISSVPLDMVDRDASVRLNQQNKLEFDLPPAIQ